MNKKRERGGGEGDCEDEVQYMAQVTEVLDTSAAAVSNQKLKYINRTFNPESLKSLLITMDCKCWQI